MKKRSQIFIFVLAAIVFLAIIFTSVYFSGSKTEKKDSENVSNLPGKIQLPGNDEKIYSSLDNEAFSDVHSYPEISHQTVKSLLSSLSTPEIYYWYYNSTIISSSKERTVNGIMKFNNGSYMIENFAGSSDGTLLKTIIEENGVVTVQTYSNARTSTAEFDSSSTNAFIEAGVPDITTFLSDEGENFNYSLHDSEYGKILYAEFVSEKNSYSQEQRYYISLDFGIVIKAECYENGRLVYDLSTITLYELDNA
jgi:hypothetical protein